MQAKEIGSLLKETFNDWMEDKAMRLAAALALYTILSLAPLLVITIKIVSMIFGDEAASGQVQQQAQSLIGSAGGQAVSDMITHASKPGQGTLATVISVIILLFTATGVFAELQDSMNTIWEVKLKPNQGIWAWVRTRFLSIGMVLGLAFLLLVSMFVSTFLTTMSEWITGGAGFISYVIDIVVSIAVTTVLFAATFKFLPDVKIAWRDVFLGAVITAVLFKLGQYGLAIYFKFGSTTSAYGAAGSFVAVLLWAYYSAQILFFGAEFTQVYARRRGSAIEPTENAVKVTEEERAQQGMPSPQRIAAKAAKAAAPSSGLPGGRFPEYSVAPSHNGGSNGAKSPRPAIVATGGMAAGLLVGMLTTKQRMKFKQRITSREAAAVDLDRRLRNLNDRLDRIATATTRVGIPVEPQPSIWKEFREGFEDGNR